MKKALIYLILLLISSNINAQYCIPIFTSPCSSNDYIDGVKFMGIDNDSTGCNGNLNNYELVTADTAQIVVGATHSITLTPTTAYPQGFGVWIDYNIDGDFSDPGEFVLSTTVGSVPVNSSISVPGTASVGSTVMRVRCVYNVPVLEGDSCNSKNYGETEDYPVYISPPPPNDVGLSIIDAPSSSCLLSSSEIITVQVINFGLNTQTNIPVSYRVDGGSAVNETIAGPLGSGDTAIYSFTTTYDLSTPGNYIFDAWTDLSTDATATNDSTLGKSVNIYPIVSSFPYFQDFESGSGDWATGGINSSWAFGLPQKSTIDTAASGINAWVTGGLVGGFYNANESSFVQGPCFDFSSLSQPIIELNIWWDSQFSMDGTVLQTSIDGGVNWQNVGAYGDPYNWYTDSTVFGNPGGQQHAWSGTGGSGSNQWLSARHYLDGLGGESSVLIRISFGSNNSINYDGFAFDDVSIFETPANEVGVVSIESPLSGCGLSTAEVVTIKVVNYGTVTQTNIPVSYRVNGGAPNNETMSGPIIPGDTGIYSFTSTANLSTPGSYVFDAWTNLPGDGFTINDSIIGYAVDGYTVVSTFPYLEDFESGPGDWAVGGVNASWALGLPQKTVIDTAASGVNAWVTGGLSTGSYNSNEDSYVISPCFDFSGLVIPIVNLNVWWNSEAGWDGAVLQSSIDGGLSWQNIGAFGDPDNWFNASVLQGGPGGQLEGWGGRNSSSNGSDGWVNARHTVPTLGGESSVLIRIAFGSDVGVNDDGFAFDDFSIVESPADDLGIISITSPISSCDLTASESITVSMVNYGVAAQTNIQVSYAVNGGTPVNEIIPGPINTGDTVSYTFTTPYDLSSPGTYVIDSWTSLGGDADSNNDSTTNYSVDNIRIISSYPYFENFESGNNDWKTGGINSSWELGIPQKTTINTPASGLNSWVTGGLGTDQYNASENSYVKGPCFDFTSIAVPIFEFRIWWNAEFSWDGAVLQSSIDGGNSWENVGSIGDPDNWYTDSTINGNPGGQQRGWTGRNATSNGSDGWVTAKNSAPALGGINDVLLRIAFGSDNSIHDDGFAFDDIRIYDTPVNDIGIIAFVTPQSLCNLTTTEQVTIIVKNFGLADQSNIPVSYNFNGGTAVNELITDTILAGESFTYTFNGTADLTALIGYSFNTWSSLTSDSIGFNDSLIGHAVQNNPIFSSFPFEETFESEIVCATACGTLCPLAGNWSNSTEDDADWIVNKGGTQTGNTGPTVDQTLGTVDGNYLYIESSTPCNPSKEAILTSQCIDVSTINTPQLTFWYHMFGASTGVLYIEVDTAGLWYTVDTLLGQQQLQGTDPWLKRSVTLPSISGTIRVRLRGVTGTGVFGDMAIDDLTIRETPLNDVSVQEITGPASGCGLTPSENIVIEITNLGLNPATNFPVSYAINGNAPINEIVIDTILVGQTYTYTFSQSADLTNQAQNSISVYSSLTGDENLSNDTVVSNIFYGDVEVFVVIKTSIWAAEIEWEISDNATGSVVAAGSGYVDSTVYVDTVCLNSLSNYTFTAIDGYGDGWNNGTYAITRCDTSNIVINNGGNTPDNSNCCGSEIESTEGFSVYPCIPNNLGVIAVTEPVSSCELSDSAIVTVQIFNFGDSAQVNYPVGYQLNGGAPILEIIADSIKSGEMYTYSFTTTTDLSTLSNHLINAWTALSNDSIKANDTLFGYSVVDADVSSFPYKEDFETFIPGLPGTLQNKWTNDSLDNFDWYVHTGPTPTASTGPDGDRSSGSGVYMYARAAFNTPADTAILYSPCINISLLPNPRLGFWYHMYGAATGGLYVEWDSSGTWVQLAEITGSQQSASSDPWRRAKINLASYGNMRQLRFIAITTNADNGDIALDDIKIYSEHCNNGISDFGEEGIDCGGEDCETICPVTFQRSYGGVEEEYGYSAVQTNDGGHIIAATTKSYGFAQTLTDIYVIKIDSLGDTLWTSTYGETGKDFVNAISQTDDSGYIIAGHTESFGVGANKNDFYLIKIDSTGANEWSKTYTRGSSSKDMCYSVIQTADLGYALIGKSSGTSGSFAVKTDASGNVVWNNRINDVDLRSIVQIDTNEFIVSGSTTADPYDAVLMRVNLNTSSIVWSKRYGGYGRDFGSSLDQTSDGGYIIGGHSFSFGSGGNPVAYLIKTDSAGVLDWSNTYGGPEADYSYSVKQTNDNGYIFSGETRSFGNSGNNLLLVKADSVGGVVWSRVFDAGYVYSGNGVHVEQTADNGYLAIGSTKKIGTGTFANSWSDLDEPDVYLVKTDPFGNTFLCYETDITFTIDTTIPTTLENTLTVTMSSVGSETSRTTISNPTTTETINLNYIDITNFITNDVSCYNGSDGYAVVEFTGGTDHFNYTWTKANPYYGWSYSADSAYSLRADDYYVTISAKNACTSSDTVSISQPDATVSAPYTTTPTSCFGATDGAIDITVIGGTPPFNYSWSTGDSTANISNLSSDSYTLQVLDSNSCLLVEYMTVTEPAQLDASYNITSVNCKSGNDGAVNMTMNTGVAPYTYSWSTGGNSQDVDSLISGTYFVTVTDDDNCLMEDSIVISEPDSLMTGMSQQSTSCNGYCDGTTTVTGLGGTLPYSYQWDDPSNQVTATATGLCVLTYNVTLTDANSCVTTDSIVLSEPAVLTTIMSKTDVTCYGNGDGTATAVVSGGSTPYTYLWNNGQNTSTSVGLFPGTYGVNVFDANGCLTSNNIVVNEPPAMSASINASSVSCISGSNGIADLGIVGGTAPYSYLWSTGDTTEDISGLAAGAYSVMVTDSCGSVISSATTINEPDSLASSILAQEVSCNAGTDGAADLSISGGTAPYDYLWSNGDSTEDISGVMTGTYSVVITDFCGQMISDTVVVAEPSALTSSITGVNVNCYGGGDGSATTTASGGTLPYLYSWNNGQTNSDAVGLFAGNYTVNIVDVNGCLASNIITIAEPTALVLATTTIGATCNNADGYSSVSVSGGTTPYIYSWNDPSSQTASIATALTVGNYTVNIVDGNNCADSADVIVETMVETPQVCLVSVDSATKRYVIVWEKTGVPVDSFRIYRESATTGVYDLIGAQAYSVESSFIDQASYPEVKSELYKISSLDSCGNESVLSLYHRSLHLISSPGLGNNVVLSWDNYIGFAFAKYKIWRGSNPSSMSVLDSVSSSISNYTDTMPPTLDSLFYLIEVIHPTGCVATKQKNFNSSKSNTSSISTISDLSASVSTNDASFGICNGEATVTGAGGEAPYTYQWDAASGDQTSQIATGLCAGMYDVTVFDANGDSVMTDGAVGQVGGIITATTVSTDAATGSCDGTATVTALGGFEPYTYVWDGNAGSQTSQTANNLCPGTYSVTIIDSLGNQALAFATVSTMIGIENIITYGFEVNIYPNPNRGIFKLELNLFEEEQIIVEIYNIHGQKITSEDLGSISGEVVEPINISRFASGVYYIRIISDTNLTLRKIIVE